MQGSFRRSREEQSDVGAISAWLRMGEQEAEKQDGPKYDRTKFEATLNQVRKLTTPPPEEFEPHFELYLNPQGWLLFWYRLVWANIEGKFG